MSSSQMEITPTGRNALLRVVLIWAGKVGRGQEMVGRGRARWRWWLVIGPGGGGGWSSAQVEAQVRPDPDRADGSHRNLCRDHSAPAADISPREQLRPSRSPGYCGDRDPEQLARPPASHREPSPCPPSTGLPSGGLTSSPDSSSVPVFTSPFWRQTHSQEDEECPAEAKGEELGLGGGPWVEDPAADLGWKQPSDPCFPARPIVNPEWPLADWGAGLRRLCTAVALTLAGKALGAQLSSAGGPPPPPRPVQPSPAPARGAGNTHTTLLASPGPWAVLPQAGSTSRTVSSPKSMPSLAEPSPQGLPVFPREGKRSGVSAEPSLCVHRWPRAPRTPFGDQGLVSVPMDVESRAGKMCASLQGQPGSLTHISPSKNLWGRHGSARSRGNTFSDCAGCPPHPSSIFKLSSPTYDTL
ncbi:uncharacterized protein WM277_012738 [Molossus nigricans]